MKDKFPLVHVKHECFQEYSGKISLVLWCYGCNLNCSWCSMKDLIYNKENILYTDYTYHIKNRTELEDAVVFLGGEPTIHPEGLFKACALAKSYGLNTKVFTNGTNVDTILKLISYNVLDAVSVDYKYYSFDIENFLDRICNHGVSTDVRITKYPNIEKFEDMKYKIENEYSWTNLYIQKYKKL